MIVKDVILLALHDQKGTKESGIRALEYGLPGALIVDLALAKRINLKENKILVVDGQNTGNELLDEALEIITNCEKDKDAKYWIREIHKKIKNLQSRLLDQLVVEGILIKKKETFLRIFTRHRYPSLNPQYEFEIRDELRSILLYNTEPDERSALLISLVVACNILPVLFPIKSERKIAEKRAEELSSGSFIGNGIREIINEVSAAVLFIVIHAAVM